MLENVCNIAIELFRTVSKIGHAEWVNIQARFVAWRTNAMAIKISALESALRVLWCGACLEKNR